MYLSKKFYIDVKLINKNLSSFWDISYKFYYKMQIKYDINAPDFMIIEHDICVSSNTIFEFKVVKT
jgi:hypothetical protein